MPHSPGKFCIDRELVRWSLLNGIITRKTLQDPPTGGRELAASRVTAIEKITVKKTKRQPLGRPMTVLGVVFLLLAWASGALLVQLPLGLAALALLYKGLKRMQVRTEEVEAHQIMAPGARPEDWVVVGSASELLGFLEAVKAESAAQGQSTETATPAQV